MVLHPCLHVTDVTVALWRYLLKFEVPGNSFIVWSPAGSASGISQQQA